MTGKRAQESPAHYGRDVTPCLEAEYSSVPVAGGSEIADGDGDVIESLQC
jgi:hypothetical protein